MVYFSKIPNQDFFLSISKIDCHETSVVERWRTVSFYTDQIGANVSRPSSLPANISTSASPTAQPSLASPFSNSSSPPWRWVAQFIVILRRKVAAPMSSARATIVEMGGSIFLQRISRFPWGRSSMNLHQFFSLLIFKKEKEKKRIISIEGKLLFFVFGPEI